MTAETTEASERERRAKGERSLYYSESKGCWIAEATVGYAGNGRRIVRRGMAKDDEKLAEKRLDAKIKEFEKGLVVGWDRMTVSRAVEDWLKFERSDVVKKTRDGNEEDYRNHIKPHLGGRRLKDLRPGEVDRWLLQLSEKLSTSALKQVRSVLKRSIDRAIKHGYVERNVVDLCKPPRGRIGRPSRSLTLDQARAVLTATTEHPMHAYIVTSLLAGLRPEEVRALRWDHVHLNPDDGQRPHVWVWRSVRLGNDTKTPKSRRTLGLSEFVVTTLRKRRADQAEEMRTAGSKWQESGLVFTSSTGTLLDASNVRKGFRDALSLVEGIDPTAWAPRDLRHSFASIMSQHGVPIEEISRLMGHAGTAVTELVYRKELRPVLQDGARVMDDVFGASSSADETELGAEAGGLDTAPDDGA